MKRRLAPGIRQHETHEDLVGRAYLPAGPLSPRSLDAIIVPAARTAPHLDHAITLAQAVRCQLVVLCSRQARADDINQLLASRSFTEAVVIDLPPGYGHRWLEFATSHPEKIGKLPEACAARDSDLSMKRNIGLILARMVGWDRVFFMDDDIRNVGYDDLRRTVSLLGPRYYSVGMRVTDFPDNSVVCHAHRSTGEFQDVLATGSALAVDCTAPLSFFPDVYKRDWLFFYDDAAEHRLGYSGANATQLRYDPFDDPQRAARQEFGDALTEGLYALLHRGQTTAYATLDYWIDFLDARRRFLDAIIARADRAPPEVRQKLLHSVRAARECSAEIQPEFCEHYVRLWRQDLGRWEQILKELPRLSSLAEALSQLGFRTVVATRGSPLLKPNAAMLGYMSGNVAGLDGRDAFADVRDEVLTRSAGAGEPFGEARAAQVDNDASQPSARRSPVEGPEAGQASLLFRVYIPSERLYAAEAQRLLSLFREWLTKTRGRGVRQDGYRTASGAMYEFFVDASVSQSDLREQFDSFSDFLTLCAEDPSTAVDLLVKTSLGPASSTDLVASFGREVHRLQTDLRHERERRMLMIRHSLDDQLLENGIDLGVVSSSQLNAMVESLVPGPSATESLALLAAPWISQPTGPVTVNIHPQFIADAVESTIIQNIRGTVHLGPQAKELLALIGQFGGQQAALLESAVYELEDADARPAARAAAKRRLKKFLDQIAGTVRDVGTDLFAKYLEHKAGL